MQIIYKYLKKKGQYKSTKKFYQKKKSNLVLLKKYKPNLKPFKKKKKWKNWRQFKKFFLFKKKIYFFAKIKWRFNNVRILWHQLTKMYLPTIKKLITNWKKNKTNKFYFFLKNLELRLSTLILRARFCYKLTNSYNAIKLNLILVNGIIINKIWCFVNIFDLIQKRRTLKPNKKKVPKTIKTKKNKQKNLFRTERYKWRRYHWNKSKYIIWKIRRISHFNLYFSQKQNNFINYLEINYKIPAFIVLKQPFLKELYLNKQPHILTKVILKKIYYLY